MFEKAFHIEWNDWGQGWGDDW